MALQKPTPDTPFRESRTTQYQVLQQLEIFLTMKPHKNTPNSL